MYLTEHFVYFKLFWLTILVYNIHVNVYMLFMFKLLDSKFIEILWMEVTKLEMLYYYCLSKLEISFKN